MRNVIPGESPHPYSKVPPVWEMSYRETVPRSFLKATVGMTNVIPDASPRPGSSIGPVWQMSYRDTCAPPTPATEKPIFRHLHYLYHFIILFNVLVWIISHLPDVLLFPKRNISHWDRISICPLFCQKNNNIVLWINDSSAILHGFLRRFWIRYQNKI